MFSRIASLRLALCLPMFTLLFDSETARVGGSGGNHTVTMDCGSGAFIVGVTATGGRDNPVGFNLLRRVSFSCRAFSGTTPGSATSTTATAVAGQSASANVSQGNGTCQSGSVAQSLELYAGTFIDRLNTLGCLAAGESQTLVNINAGGDGGSRQFVECPSGEALYKIVAKTGDAIDSFKGYCRTFLPPATLGILSQISNTVSPKPSPANPLAVPPASTRSLTFKVLTPDPTHLVFVGITAETDLLGGGAANPPEYRLDLVNPSGQVVAAKTFTNPPTLFIQSVSTRFNVAGTWSLKIVNLKKQIGGLSVRAFDTGFP